MKHLLSPTLSFCLFWIFFQTTQATPQNLYEQLCEVNQEWYKNRTIAEQLGFLHAPAIKNEQALLTFHIQALESIFLARNPALPANQKQARAKHLQVLHQYANLRDCPRNYYLPYRNPVFIDHEGRYCAVAYLMKNSGKEAFCKSVQQASNFVYVRAIQSPEFHDWQQTSGLSTDELAWIQPGYMPDVRFIEWDKRMPNGDLIDIDSSKSLLIYNPFYDNTDMFNFRRMFWDFRLESAKISKKIKTPYFGKPDWTKIEGRIIAVEVFKGELYASVDTTDIIGADGVSYRQNMIIKWSKKGRWQEIKLLPLQAQTYCFFIDKNKLHIGGYVLGNPQKIKTGDHEYEQQLTHSYLATFDGAKWVESKAEYGGIVFGLIYKNKKRYLGVVVNNMGFESTARPPLRAEPK